MQRLTRSLGLEDRAMFRFFKRKKRSRRNVTISAPLQVSRERKEEGQRGGGGLLHVSSPPDRQSKVLYLEKQVMAQQQEITSLKGVIKNLR